MGKIPSPYRLVGLISGTSMHGIDAAAIELTDPPFRAELHAFLTVPCPPEVHGRLRALCRDASGWDFLAAAEAHDAAR